MSAGRRFQQILTLIKIKITVAVGLSTAFGYLLATDALTIELCIPVVGIFTLACGSAALNEYQERQIDARMSRTRHRPLASREIGPVTAWVIILVLIVTGSLILYVGTRTSVLLLGLFALLWYNGVYTPLKRITAFAAVPGAIIGTIPPLTGWVAAGGKMSDPLIQFIVFFFFMWQVPHFWLLLVESGNDYQEAGLPSIKSIFSPAQLSRITFSWLFSTGIAGLLVLQFVRLNSLFVKFSLPGLILWLIYSAIRLLRTSQDSRFSFKYAFTNLNVFALLVVLFISIDKLMNVL